MSFLEDSQKIGEALKSIPKIWAAKEAIIEMKSVDYPHWKQMEWIGFYFQYLCEKYLSDFVKISGPRYGNVSFDGFYKIPWDFKAHAMNTSGHQIIVNDSEATSKAIKEYAAVGLILAIGKVEYNDEKRTFQKWHEEIKGGKSGYEIERIKRGAWSRLRKVSFDLQQISFIRITDKTLIKCGSFQTDFRNANGSPRRSKVLVNLENIDEELEYFIEFKKEEFITGSRDEYIDKILTEIEEGVKFKEYLPVFDLAAACGKFGEGTDAAPLGWMKVNGGREFDDNWFITQVFGHSMEPKIPDKSWCVFRKYQGGTRQNLIVLAQHRGISDSDTGGAYSVKKYTSKKKEKDIESWQHAGIILEPLNKDYPPIVISEDTVEDFKIIAEFIKVLK